MLTYATRPSEELKTRALGICSACQAKICSGPLKLPASLQIVVLAPGKIYSRISSILPCPDLVLITTRAENLIICSIFQSSVNHPNNHPYAPVTD
eukprot:sb/3479306/